ncbi:MAG: tRNA dimethylallyltransferase [Erysipelotrichaceae bacterium]|nr:MAG: hypothetical protein FD179_254 [Erysipelotrichaceae bacterium]TXT19936.1 MAG: tRNA dimethylallyltransferase [Erysipelotrichaceae bacterium]
MKKVLVIAGPTASGKSIFAIECAIAFNGEIINGDSQQIYTQLNIGTAKITQEDQKGIPHHLLNILDYSQPYSVADFQKICRESIQIISNKHKLAVLCGGSGHYLKSVLYDYAFPKEDTPQETFDSISDEELYEQLLNIDPIAAQKIHLNNRKRVIRAINMGLSGTLKSEREAAQNHRPIYDVYMVVLDIERALLYERIENRVELMFKQGLEEEVRTYFSSQDAQCFQSFLGIGYKEFREVLNENKDVELAKSDIITHTRQYAKRQLTWFRHQFSATWADPTNQEAMKQVMEDISHWLHKENT